jgi:hypothetical protein
MIQWYVISPYISRQVYLFQSSEVCKQWLHTKCVGFDRKDVPKKFTCNCCMTAKLNLPALTRRFFLKMALLLQAQKSLVVCIQMI